MQLGFYFNQTRCVGCYTCSVACKDWHDIPAGRANWLGVTCIEEGTFPNPFVAYLIRPCLHCADPPCISACPVDAITTRETDGIVIVDREICLGESSCSACRDVCPYDAPQFGDEADAKMQKCDLCQDRWDEGKKPICVEGCPLSALDAGPIEKLKQTYGDSREASGFLFNATAGPSIVLKGKMNADKG